jgi:hypothetical protein
VAPRKATLTLADGRYRTPAGDRSPERAMYIENVALILSLFALVVAGLTALHTRGYERRDNELQARILTLEEARERDRIAETSRAELVAEHTSTVHDGRVRRVLRISNRGRAPAHVIDVQLNGAPLAGNPLSPWTKACVSSLGPGSSADYILSDAMLKTAAMFIAVVTWSDGTGDPRRNETELSTH